MQRLRDAFHIYLRHLAQGHGWEVDRVSDFARLVRVPGTINHKPEKSCPSVPVTLLEHHPEARYAPAALATFLRACGEQFDPDREAAPEDARFPSDTTPGTEAAGQYWLDRYMAKVKAEQDGRRRYGFALACQLRDAHLSLSAAEPFMRRYQAEFKVQHGKGHYTWSEAERTLKSAYSRDPRAKAQEQAASLRSVGRAPAECVPAVGSYPSRLQARRQQVTKRDTSSARYGSISAPTPAVHDGLIPELPRGALDHG